MRNSSIGRSKPWARLHCPPLGGVSSSKTTPSSQTDAPLRPSAEATPLLDYLQSAGIPIPVGTLAQLLTANNGRTYSFEDKPAMPVDIETARRLITKYFPSPANGGQGFHSRDAIIILLPLVIVDEAADLNRLHEMRMALEARCTVSARMSNSFDTYGSEFRRQSKWWVGTVLHVAAAR